MVDQTTPQRARTAGPRWSGWTTQRWLAAGIGIIVAVFLVLGLLGGWAMGRADAATSSMVDRSTPALTAAVRLEEALVNQETGIRGYGLSGQPSFLQPYTDGVADEQNAVADLRPLLAGNAVGRADLDTVLARVQTWQDSVAKPIATAPPGTPNARATQDADQAKADFDAIRAAAATQQDHLAADRARSQADLDRAQELTYWTFSAIAAAVLALLALAFAGLRAITNPLALLSRNVRRVSTGDFAHPVGATTGPADLRQLASDVEAMRYRLAAELAFADQARALLDEQATDLRRSNTELEQFAYVASHDLQEPLRKVASFCQLLQRRYAENLDERANQYIGFAVDGANRMQTLINDLLAFSRVGRLHRQYKPVDLEEVLEAATDSLSVAIEESGARVTSESLPTLPGDTTQLTMLLQNLLGNAIKFRSPDRTPRIAVSARRDGDLWHFAVTDNGIGISAEYAERIFVIFQRLHTREEYSGNGIGLAMCKKIVEFHGGTIDIDTDHTEGTRVRFSLAAEPRDQHTDAAESASRQQTAQPAADEQAERLR